MERYKGPKSIDAYIKTYPPKTQKILREIRATIKAAAPEAGETISYAIPTFTLNGNLVHFAAFEHHIGFYPTSSGIAAFRRELARYATSKGTVQFPIDEPIPLKLITRMVKFRVAEQMKKSKK